MSADGFRRPNSAGLYRSLVSAESDSSATATDACAGWIPDVPAKDDTATMELPFFALQAGDTRQRTYKDARYQIEIIPCALGAATQRDKDILLFCVSQLMSVRDRESQAINRKVRASAHAILDFCGRGSSGKDYERLLRALERLRGTTVRTDYATAGKRITEGFGFIESFRIERDALAGRRMQFVEITISEWMFNSVRAANVLTINRAYFGLSSDLARRLYEIVRKHCGNQSKWAISLQRLLDKSGSRGSLPEFRRKVKRIADDDTLPDYCVVIDDEKDFAKFYARAPGGHIARIRDGFAKARSARR